MLRTKYTFSLAAAAIAVLVVGCAPASGPNAASGNNEEPTAVQPGESGPVAMDIGATMSPGGGPGSGGGAGAAPRTDDQGGAESPRQGGGGGPQAGGGGGGGRRGGGMGFLVSDQIVAELKLTDEQVEQIRAAMPQRGQGGQETTPEERQKQREEAEAKIAKILKPEQTKRMKEIQLQMQGPRALTQPEVAKSLGLSADQVTKIEAALEVPRPEGGQSPGGGGGGFDREAFMKARQEANEKALAVLTADQKKKWEAMLGKPFEWQMPQGGGGGGGAQAAGTPVIG